LDICNEKPLSLDSEKYLWTIPRMLVSWAVLLSGPLDAIEKPAILRMLGGSQNAPVPQIASIAAALKFTLVLAAFGYLAAGGLRALIYLLYQKTRDAAGLMTAEKFLITDHR
jgi:hypothetical protein